jgi:uncharacterized Fe-S cluster protein YjdI
MRAAMGGKYSRDDSRREALNVREMERQRMEESAQTRADKPQRDYRNERIAVHWNPSRCVHSERCMRGLPQVFQPDARPWVRVDEATADEIVAVVARCPSGALHVERLDGGVIKEPGEPVIVEPQPNGPLYFRGPMRILGANGAVLREDTRMALCRCGHSRNKPFCDGSHETSGFQA